MVRPRFSHLSEVTQREGTTESPRFKPYPAYKDSAVEWLGEIPAHWSAKRLKFVAAEPIRNGIGEAGAYDDPEWPRYVRITDIAGPRELREDTFKSLPAELAREAPFKVGDLLLAAVGATFGKSYLHVRDIGPACFAGYLVRFSPGREADSSFAAYWTESSAYWVQVRSRVVQATIQNFSAAKYKELSIPLPALPEQRAIAAFLDRETARIDALVAKKERLIELLQEKRTALITRAVTKGLDPTVPMKDSGVEWLGEIPAHWEVRPLRAACEIRGRIGFRGYSVTDIVLPGEGAITLSPGNILDDGLDLSQCTYLSWNKYRESPEIQIEPNDIILTKTGSTLGKVAIVVEVDEPMTINPQLVILRSRNGTDSGFVAYVLRCEGIKDLYWLENSGGATPTISQEKVGRFTVPLPPTTEEQQRIAAFIRGEMSRIDALTTKVRDAIDRLKELRTALISAAVTGKIDVREEVA